MASKKMEKICEKLKKIGENFLFAVVQTVFVDGYIL